METDSRFADPRYEEEVSGCTASVAILSAKQIFVVSARNFRGRLSAHYSREMLEIRAAFLVLRDGRSLFLSTTSHRTKV